MGERFEQTIGDERVGHGGLVRVEAERQDVHGARRYHERARDDLERQVLGVAEAVAGIGGEVGGRFEHADREHELGDGVSDGEDAALHLAADADDNDEQEKRG